MEARYLTASNVTEQNSFGYIYWPDITNSVTNPYQCEKINAPIIAAHDGPAKTKDAATAHNHFTMPWADLDDTELSLADIVANLKSIGLKSFAVYATASHQPAAPRYRVLVHLTKGVDLDRWEGFQRCLMIRLDGDECALRPQQIAFLPIVGPHYVCHVEEGAPLNPDDLAHPFVKHAAMIQAEWELAEARAQRVREAKVTPRAVKSETGQTDDVIGQFDQAHDIETTLRGYGYTPPKSGKGKWKAPSSQSGIAGVFVNRDSNTMWSEHTSDPMANGKQNSPFALFCHYEHGGDISKAVRAAAELLGIEHKKSDRPRPQQSKPTVNTGAQSKPAQDSAQNPQEWHAPQELITNTQGKPYPVDALPPRIKAAVEEVQGFVQVPLSMAVSSALGVLSTACQGYVDVQRAAGLEGPTSLYLMAIADSGERKSSCDGHFVKALTEWQEFKLDEIADDIKRNRAEIAAWKAERDGILQAIKAAGSKGRPTKDIKQKLHELDDCEPAALMAPEYILGDETPESLAYKLAHTWPTAGVISNEAGVVFGSHGMGKESAMRNMALLNIAWDGGTLSVGRKTSDSFKVRGARLTMGLQIQNSTLREFVQQTGPLARGTGFFARFLISWPESNIGNRPFQEPPEGWPSLTAYKARVRAILDEALPFADEGKGVAPELLVPTDEARAAWIAYHDQVEGMMAPYGELCDITDVAAKSADNAMRLAGLFQMFEHGPTDISLEIFNGAARIAAWHLSEAQRFFNEVSVSPDMLDVIRLDQWLRNQCVGAYQAVGKNHTLQNGPLRKKDQLNAAIETLTELDRLREEKEGRRVVLALNPALMKGGEL